MESGQRRRAGCGAPLWPCSERNTSRYSPAFHAELAATAGVEAREVFPCSDRTASDMCSPTISGECLPACSADWDNLTLRRGPRACPMASTHKIRRHRAARARGLLAPKEQLAGLRLVSGRGNSLWRPAAQLSLRVGGNSEALRRARDGPWGEGGRWGGEGEGGLPNRQSWCLRRDETRCLGARRAHVTVRWNHDPWVAPAWSRRSREAGRAGRRASPMQGRRLPHLLRGQIEHLASTQLEHRQQHRQRFLTVLYFLPVLLSSRSAAIASPS